IVEGDEVQADVETFLVFVQPCGADFRPVGFLAFTPHVVDGVGRLAVGLGGHGHILLWFCRQHLAARRGPLEPMALGDVTKWRGIPPMPVPSSMSIPSWPKLLASP